MDSVERMQSVEGRTPPKQHNYKSEPVEDDNSIASETHNIFDDNSQCLIDNPLIRLKPDEVERKARQFVREHGLENQEAIFIKAGKVLRDPEAWRSVPYLSEEEKSALNTESDRGFWRQPKDLKITIITLCVAAICQGWNQTASNGANLNWPSQLGLTNVSQCEPFGKDAWIFAAVNAAPYFSASLVGCWASDPLNEYFFGRRPAICFSAILIFASMIGGACSTTWRQLLACRVILGIGMGCKASVAPVFAAEVSPAHIRGSLVMNWQLFDALGIFFGFTANLVVSQVGPTAWRWQTASSVIPAIVLLTLIFVSSESPRFLMKRGANQYPRAYRTLLSLRGHPILAAKELLYVHFQMRVEKQLISGNLADPEASLAVEKESQNFARKYLNRVKSGDTINYWQKLGQLFTQKRIRRAMVAAVVCMVSQQLCGVNVLAIYSSTIFCAAGNNESRLQDSRYTVPLFLSWGIGLSNFVFAIPAYWYIDSKGRRWLLLVALPFMALSMLAAGLSFDISGQNPAHTPVIGLFTYIFMFFYSPSMGPVPYTLSAEVFPLENRVVGMSFAVFTNMLGLGLLVLFVPVITSKIGHPGLLGIFAGLNVVAFILVFFFVRETAGATLGRNAGGTLSFISLEELNYVFGVSSKQHATYQLRTVLPWVWNRYVRRDPRCPARPMQLYTWANVKKAEEEDNLSEDAHEGC